MNFIIHRRTLSVAIMLATGAGCMGYGAMATAAGTAGAAQPMVTVKHAKGEAKLPLAPQRVVVYDLASLDTMQALKLPVTGVPKANFPAYMAGYADARYTVAGSLFEPDYEALSQVKPDLIVVAGRSASKFDILSKIAPTLDLSIDNKHMLTDMQRNVNTLASLWGKQAQGQQLMAQVRGDVQAVQALAGKAGPGLLVLAINTNMSGQAPGSRFGLLHDVLGVQPALAADPAKPRGVPLKMEDIARINPEWLYVIDRNAGTGTTKDKEGKPVTPSRELFDNEIIKNTTAGKKQQVVFVDPQIWYLMGSAGPISMRENAAQIKQALQAGR